MVVVEVTILEVVEAMEVAAVAVATNPSKVAAAEAAGRLTSDDSNTTCIHPQISNEQFCRKFERTIADRNG